MDERNQPERNENLDQEMEHDAEIRRDTAVQNALGPIDEEETDEEIGRDEEEGDLV
jgi:hypothetical protein